MNNISEHTERTIKAFADKFKVQDRAIHRELKTFFVRKRAIFLAQKHPQWDSDPLQQDMYWRLYHEIDAVTKYVSTKMSIAYGKEKENPKHLDRQKLSQLTQSPSSGEVGKRMAAITIDRFRLIQNIIWRAAAIHEQLWTAQSVQLAANEPAKAALNELVDRRLHIVERLAYNVNGGIKQRKWHITGVDKPWDDGVLVRMFEYPWLPKKPFIPYLEQMKKIYWWEDNDNLIYDAGGITFRVAPSVITEWTALPPYSGTWYYPKLAPNKHTPAEIFESMFTPSPDFFHRSWLYCDQVAAAVNIEALRFALLRRERSNKLFNEKITEGIEKRKKNNKDYVMLGSQLTTDSQDRGILMADKNDPFFENIEIEPDDVQIGDELIFWNHQIYDLVTTGAWRNEYSHVMDVESDPNTGKTSLKSLRLAGHGIPTTDTAKMAMELVYHIKKKVDEIQKFITEELKKKPNIERIHWPGNQIKLHIIKWAPYGETFAPPGAWWIEVPKNFWYDKWYFNTVTDAVEGIPKTVCKDMSAGNGYSWSNLVNNDSLLFPLYDLIFPEKDPLLERDSWNAYLKYRRSSDKIARPILRPISVDGKLAPALNYRGKKRKIPVIRPKVRK